MSRLARFVAPGLLAALLAPLAAQAQYLSEKVGFNGPGLPADAQEMFRIPEFNSVSAGFIIKNSPGLYDYNAAYRAAGLHTEGSAAEQVFFRWLDPNNPLNTYAWVRLSTFNGPIRPNPSVHLGGKVRFKIRNRSEIIRGRIGLAIAVRETGANVPQMEDGGTSGTVEFVGVSTTPNGITAGANGIVNTTASGDDVQVRAPGFDVNTDPNILDKTGFAVIAPGTNGTIDTIPAGDDQLRKGYSLDPNQNRYPIPVTTVIQSGTARDVEFNLATGQAYLGGVLQGGGFAPLSTNGDGVLDPNSRGTLECLAITKINTDTATLIEFAIDELQFEAPAADPTRPPLLQGPLVVGNTTITVSNIQYAANRVRIWRVGSPSFVAEDTIGFPKTSSTLTVPALQTGQIYYATIRNGQNGEESAPSNQETVYGTPPPMSFSMLIDESGSGSCSTSAPGWEWVGVTAAVPTDPVYANWTPQGQAIIPDSAIWRTVDIPLNDPTVVRPCLGGNGALAPSPVGYYTIDSVWFTVEPNTPVSQAGPWEILIDGVEILNASGEPISHALTMETGPGFWFARGQSWEFLESATGERTSAGSYDGSQAARILFDYDNDDDPNYPPPGLTTIDPQLSCGVLQRSESSCNRSARIPDTASGVRFHMVVRELGTDPNIPRPSIQAPVIGNQQTIRVDNDPSATLLQVYINGLLAGTATPVGTPTDINVSLSFGDSVAVKQTLPGRVVSDYSYPRAAARPLPPTLVTPILANATSVTVNGLISSTYASASVVTVYANGVVWATANPLGATSVVVTGSALPNGTVLHATQTVNGVESLPSASTVVGAVPPAPVVSPPLEAGDTTVRVQSLTTGTTLVRVYDGNSLIGEGAPPTNATFYDCPVTPLVHLHQITASQVNPSGESPRSTVAKEVGRGNGDMFIALGIRETNSTAPIGEPSAPSNTGQIEWIGATATVSGAPIGKPAPLSPAWQTFTFDPNTDPIRSALGVGDGVITATRGTIEHIAFTIDANSLNKSVGAYRIYIDNVINVGADPNTGADVNIGAGFESYTVGQEVMFQEPSFSGSTTGNVELPSTFPLVPNYSAISDEQGNPGKSIKTSWVFVSSSAGRWVRLTTSSTGQPLRNPTIDLTKPVKFDILLLPVFPPDPPTLSDPVLAGDTIVTVRSVSPESSEVRVYADGVQIGSVNPNGNTTVDVPVPALIALQSITAKQVSPTAGVGFASNALEVGRANGPLKIAIGVRETGDTGPLGSQGSGTGPIEFVGVSAPGTPPQGIPVSPSPVWQTLTFNLQDPNIVESFSAGNGTIDGTRGTLEHLAVTVDSAAANRSAGIYTLYVDNVVNVGADPNTGGDFVIADFDDFPLGGEALFQEPTYSGTTAAHMLALPSSSSVRDTFGNPGNSARLIWMFRDSGNTRWARITTSSVVRVPSPIIDLTKPIRLDVLLIDDCVFKGDLDGDLDVDIDDFNLFAACLLGVDIQIAPSCTCADFDDDGKVDLFDAAEFQASFNP